MKKVKKEELSKATSALKFDLTEQQLEALNNGESIDVREIALTESFGMGCSGIKLADLGGNCGLYYNPPFGISVCCLT